jgi:hypothetical protein
LYLLHRHRRQVVPVLCRRERGSRVLTRRSVRGLRAADAAAIVARLEHLQRCTKSRIVSLRFGTARRDRECSLNDGQVPNRNAVRVAFSTWYHRVEGNRRASRNGPVSDLPPRTCAIRNCCIAVDSQLLHRCRFATVASLSHLEQQRRVPDARAVERGGDAVRAALQPAVLRPKHLHNDR